MPNYTCSTCGKIFNDKFNYTTHLKRKFPCKPKSNINQNESLRNQNEIQNTKEYKCGYCGKIFSTNSNWNRHIKEYCKVKKQQDNEKKVIYNNLLEKFDELNSTVNKLKKKSELLEKKNKELEIELKKVQKISNVDNVTNIIENQNNIENQNIINVNLIAYGREDLSKIDSSYILEALQRGSASVPVLTERIHFNVKYPEFQNVYIPNMSHQYCMVYNGTEWLLKDKNNVIDYIYSQSYYHLDNNFEEFYEKLPINKQKSFKEFIKIHEKAEDNNDPEALKIILGIKNDLKLLLYNKRNIILDKQKSKI